MKWTLFFFALMLLASLSIWKIAHAEDYAKYNQYQSREDLEKRLMDTFSK